MSQDKKADNPYKVNVESIESSESFQTGIQVIDKGVHYIQRNVHPYDYTHYHDGRNWRPVQRIRQQPSPPPEQPWTELLKSNEKLQDVLEKQTKVLYDLKNKIDQLKPIKVRIEVKSSHGTMGFEINSEKKITKIYNNGPAAQKNIKVLYNNGPKVDDVIVMVGDKAVEGLNESETTQLIQERLRNYNAVILTVLREKN